MDKIKVYDDFLKSLRVALTNSSVYFKEHPILAKSIQELKEHLGRIFSLISPLKIGIAPNYLMFGEERLEDKKIYSGIIDFFHRRKIKKIEISQGVSAEELLIFLTSLNLSLKDILAKGGLENILKTEGVSHITVETLDYSQFLESEGQESKDIWLYLLDDGLKRQDGEKISQLTSKFAKNLDKFDAQELVEDEEKNAIIQKLLVYLKDKDKSKFSDYSKRLAKSILKTKELPSEVDLKKLKEYLSSLDRDDFSDILLEQFAKEDPQESLNLALFSKLISSGEHEGIASSMSTRLEQDESLRSNPQVASRIKELFSLKDSPHVAQAYQRNLFSMLEDISLGEGSSFDHDQLMSNYSLILLELFSQEASKKRIEVVLQAIFKEVKKAIDAKNIKYAKSFIDIFDKKRKEFTSLDSIFIARELEFNNFIEDVVLAHHDPSAFAEFLGRIEVSSKEPNDYLDKIFGQNIINPYILGLFFKFFSQEESLFYEGLDKKISSVAFIEKIIKCLKEINSKRSLETFKHIFPLSNNFVKIEVLKAMEDISFCDELFLFSILKKGDYLQRKHAFMMLVKNPKTRKEAAKLLLAIPNPFGLRTRVIEENLRIINENLFIEAKEYLVKLTKYKYFWNSSLRREAKKIIRKYET